MFQARHLSLILLSAFAISCAHRSENSVFTDGERIPTNPIRSVTHYTVIDFKTGDASLSDEQKEKLKALSKTALQQPKAVSAVNILAWDDDEKTQAPKLASARGLTILHTLEKELKASYQVHNMVEQPLLFSEIIHNEKTTFENTETVSFGKGPKSSLAGSKISKAVILVRYKGDPL